MTTTQILLLILAAAAVALAYYFGRSTAGERRGGSSDPRLDPANRKPVPTAVPPPVASGDRAPDASIVAQRRTATRPTIDPGPLAPAADTSTATAEQPRAIPPAAASGGRTLDASTVTQRRTPVIEPGPLTAAPETAPTRPAAPRSAPPPAASASRPATTTPSYAPSPARIANWGYQLQKLDVAHASASPYDLLVVDYAKDGSDDQALPAADVEHLQHKPGGGRRTVIAYLSIGEAESYRSYWKPEWKTQRPGWLLGENPDWAENYAVCFWDPQWQAIMCGAPHSRLDRVIAAGFDGVYLDKCDVFDDLRQRYKAVAGSRRDIEGDMIGFVARLSAYAKSRKPGFLVIMQNAEELLKSADLRRNLDGIAKESLLYGIDGPERRNTDDDVAAVAADLDLMQRDGKLVLVVEYLNNASKIEDAASAAARLGYTLYVAPKDRDLAKLNYQSLQA